MAQNISLLGASYTDVPAVKLPRTGGGTASFVDVTDTTAVASDVATGKYFYTAAGVRVEGAASSGTAVISVVDSLDTYGGTIRTVTATDISDTTAVASDVAIGKYFYTAAGVKTQGTGGGGGGATQHTIYLEFSDSTDTDIEVDYDDAWVGSLITSTTPPTYGVKTVTLAQLDGVTWYELVPVPIGVELIDYTATTKDKGINSSGEVETAEWLYVSDYTPIESSMTFTYRNSQWYYIGFYDENHNAVGTIYPYTDGTPVPDDNNTSYGTLTPAKIPATAKYIRLCGTWYDSDHMSLIRTA